MNSHLQLGQQGLSTGELLKGQNTCWGRSISQLFLQHHLSHELRLFYPDGCASASSATAMGVPKTEIFPLCLSLCFCQQFPPLCMGNSSPMSWEDHHHSMPSSQVSVQWDTWPGRQKVEGNILKKVFFFSDQFLSVGYITCRVLQISILILAHISTSTSFSWSSQSIGAHSAWSSRRYLFSRSHFLYLEDILGLTQQSSQGDLGDSFSGEASLIQIPQPSL